MSSAVCQPYRVLEIEAAVPIRLVDGAGYVNADLSRVLSCIWLMKRPRHWKVRNINAFVQFLNLVESVETHAAGQLLCGCEEARELIWSYLDLHDVSPTGALENDGSYWLDVPWSVHSRISDALVALGLVTGILARNGHFGGQDPTKIDGKMAGVRLDAAERRASKGFADRRSDTLRMFRLAGARFDVPRHSDPRFFDRLLEGLIEIGAPECVVLALTLQRRAGLRPSEPLRLTMHDYLVRSVRLARGKLWCPNLKSKAVLYKEIDFGQKVHDRIDQHVDGSHQSHGCLQDLRQMASNVATARRLKSVPLFSLDGIKPLTYNQVYVWFHRSAVSKDLFIDDERYHETGVKRFASPHWLRHEYVHARLDYAMSVDSELDRKAEERAVADYMRWADGEKMLERYAAHHRLKCGLAKAGEYNAYVDNLLKTKSHVAPLAPLIPQIPISERGLM